MMAFDVLVSSILSFISQDQVSSTFSIPDLHGGMQQACNEYGEGRSDRDLNNKS
jgi:hypothetical protein